MKIVGVGMSELFIVFVIPIVVLVAIQLVQSIVVRSLFQYAAML